MPAQPAACAWVQTALSTGLGDEARHHLRGHRFAGAGIHRATRFYVDGEVNQNLLRGNLHVQAVATQMGGRIVAALGGEVHAQV